MSGGRQAGTWSTIPVPSNWEMQGFGTYKYSDDWSRTPAPDSIGEYRHAFRVPANWRGKRVSIVIGASMTDTDVRINGRSAGPTHRGGFYQFNRAERQSDFWLFGGIFRPVWLEAAPVQHIAHVAIDARHTGAFHADVDIESSADRITAQVETMNGTAVGAPFSRCCTAWQRTRDPCVDYCRRQGMVGRVAQPISRARASRIQRRGGSRSGRDVWVSHR